MATLQVYRQEPTGIIYANPADPDLTVRFRNTSTNKTLNGVSVKNNLTEIIYNDDNLVEVATDVYANDAISVRLRVSGSPLSSSRIAEILLSLAAQIGTWNTQNVFAGFNPTSAPVIPAA